MDGDGSEVPQHMWQSGQPNNVHSGKDENCAVFGANANLVDVKCGNLYYPLCQFRIEQNLHTV